MTRLFLLAALAAASASAQPGALAPAEAGALLDRLERRGLLGDSAATALRGCVADGVPVGRAALVGAVGDGLCREAGPEWCAPFGGAGLVLSGSFGPAPVPLPSWADTLAGLGLVPPRAAEAARLFMARYRAVADSVALPPEVGLLVFGVLPQAVGRAEAVGPALVALDAAGWERAGVLSPDGRRRLLEAAEAGALGLASDAVPFFEVARPVGAALGPASSPDPLDPAWVRAVVEATNRQLAAPLRLGRVRAEPGTPRTDAARSQPGRLAVEIDGRELARRVYPSSDLGPVADVVNRALRDRGSDRRVGLTYVMAEGDPPSGRVYLLVLTEPQRDALAATPLDPGSPRHVLMEAYARVGRLDEAGRLSPPCKTAAFLTLMPLLDAEPVRWVGAAPRFDDAALATDSLRATVRMLAEAGLVRPDQVERVVEAFFLGGAGEPRAWDLLYALPDGALYPFSWEAGSWPPGYADELARWAALTDGEWTPADVETEPVGADSLRLSFRVAGRRYAEVLHAETEWYSPDFLALMLRSVEASGAPGRFYWLDDGREDVLYLRPEQAARLRSVPLFSDLARVAPGD